MRFGLLGEHLQHSYSPRIHRELHGEEYRLYEAAPGQVEEFLKKMYRIFRSLRNRWQKLRCLNRRCWEQKGM